MPQAGEPWQGMIDMLRKSIHFLFVACFTSDRMVPWKFFARHDKVTIRAHWERLARHLTGQANVHLAECDHESILDDPGTWEAIQAWFMQSGQMNDSR